MVTLLFTIMIITGILFIGSVLLMTPKGWLWFGVGGMSTSNEYGSKKSVEWTLKKTAIISIILFIFAAILYPYADKSELSTKKTNIQNPAKQTIKLNPEDINIKTSNPDAKIQIKNNNKTTENK